VFDVDKLKQPEIKAAFDLEIHNRFDVLDSTDSIEETWSNFKTTVAQVADCVVGYRMNIAKKRWISMTLGKLLMKGKRIKQQKSQGELKTEQVGDLEKKYGMKDREVKRRCAKDKQQWYDSAGELKKQQPEDTTRHCTKSSKNLQAN